MLTIRPNCEHCGKDLPHNATDARICSFECTFCESCVQEVLNNVCPNCGGGFAERPVRPQRHLSKYPVSCERVLKPVDREAHEKLVARYGATPPAFR